MDTLVITTVNFPDECRCLSVTSHSAPIISLTVIRCRRPPGPATLLLSPWGLSELKEGAGLVYINMIHSGYLVTYEQ